MNSRLNAYLNERNSLVLIREMNNFNCESPGFLPLAFGVMTIYATNQCETTFTKVIKFRLVY